MTCWIAGCSPLVIRHKQTALVLLALLAISGFSGLMRLRVCASSSSSFDIREHLSTKAPYVHRVQVQGAPSLYELPDPAGYKPVFMYLLARHGSRWPTAKRMKQINSLQRVFQAAARADSGHAWMSNWTSPMADIPYLAGELHPEGEAEMMRLARRLRSRFPTLTAEPYAPRRYPIISTQVPRAAQSASAFALGFFGRVATVNSQQPSSSSKSGRPSSSSGDGVSSETLGCWPQPVAVNMLPKKHDPVLRFFECCHGYRQHEDRAMRWLAPWMHSHWQRLIPGLEARLGLTAGSLTTCHVDALWQLCTLEAGLLNTTTHLAWLQQQEEQATARRQRRRAAGSSGGTSGWSGKGGGWAGGSYACGLFSRNDALLLEWLEDVRLFETQGYGAQVNYAVAAPLLSDIASALKSAAAAHSAGHPPLQQVRLMFAHCETLTPLASLLGLFRPGEEEQQDMPEIPSDDRLKLAVKIDRRQIEADLGEVEEVAEDLPLVLMQGQQQQQQQQQQDHDPTSGTAVLDMAVGRAGEKEAASAAEQQQQQHLGEHLPAAKRRRVLEASSSHSSSSSSSSRSEVTTQQAVTATAALPPAVLHAKPQQQQQHQEQQLGKKHEHGPAMEGCSYKGGAPLHSSLLLPPPQGWLPRFLEQDLDRNWRGGRIAPLGANLVLVLYGRDQLFGSSGSSRGSGGGSSSDRSYLSDYRVRLVYNEQVIPVPGCSNAAGDLDCSLHEFLEAVVGEKISKERYKRYCSGVGAGPLWSETRQGRAEGMLTEALSSSLSSSSSSSIESVGSMRDVSGGAYWPDHQEESTRGLELVTADGLPLLLPAADGNGRESPVVWY